MVEHLGAVIRSLRTGAGISLSTFATATTYTKANLCNIEAGRVRRLSPEFIAQCDQLFGSHPLLTLLHQFEGGDDVTRRAFLEAASLVSDGGFGQQALAEVMRAGLIADVGERDDWTQVVADFSRRLVVDPSEDYGNALMAEVVVIKQQIVEQGPSTERLRAAAQLGHLYGLWLGNQGAVPNARGWYRAAAVLAERSLDTQARVDILGRTLSRGLYEGASARETREGVAHVLHLAPAPSTGTLEAHSALVHLHALTDNLPAGREEVEAMRRVADQIDDGGERIGPTARTDHFATYLECRIGTVDTATAAYERSAPALRGAPVWAADANIYYAMALTRAGDIAEGLHLALSAVRSVPPVHVLSIGVQDLLAVVPRQHSSDELDQLREVAATGPAPWETV